MACKIYIAKFSFYTQKNLNRFLFFEARVIISDVMTTFVSSQHSSWPPRRRRAVLDDKKIETELGRYSRFRFLLTWCKMPRWRTLSMSKRGQAMRAPWENPPWYKTRLHGKQLLLSGRVWNLVVFYKLAVFIWNKKNLFVNIFCKFFATVESKLFGLWEDGRS